MFVSPDAFLNRFTKRNFSELPLVRGRLDWLVEWVWLHSDWGWWLCLLDELDSLNNTFDELVCKNSATYPWWWSLMFLKALPHLILLLLAGIGLLKLAWHTVLKFKIGLSYLLHWNLLPWLRCWGCWGWVVRHIEHFELGQYTLI